MRSCLLLLAVKAPYTATETPWHQDAGYWPFLPDTRAVSIWCAIDPATVNSGCMWFAPACPLARHAPLTEGGHVLTAVVPQTGVPAPELSPGTVLPRLRAEDAAGPAFTNAGGTPVPLEPGGATLHGGTTPHYTCGNGTAFRRRAYIMNFRPAGVPAVTIGPACVLQVAEDLTFF
jgi:phytanoyl-CoA hydroxylase